MTNNMPPLFVFFFVFGRVVIRPYSKAEWLCSQAGWAHLTSVYPRVTAETITTSQIRALRTEAAEHGDTEQVDICNHALDAAESRNRTWTVDQARALCADAINAGQG